MEGGSKTTQQAEESKQQPLRVLVLALDGATFFKLQEETTGGQTKEALVEDKQFPKFSTATIAKFTPYTGQQAIIVDEIGVHFIETNTGKERLQIVKPGISALNFSPRDTYLLTCEKFQQGEKNLTLWNTQTGKELNAFEWKKVSKEGPKSIKFMKDEKFMARLHGKTILEIYETPNVTAPKYKITAGEHLLSKKQQEELGSKKPQFKFDGFEFLPMNPDIPAHLSPMYIAVWQHSEGLSLKQEGGTVFIFDLQTSPDRPKFSVQCHRSQEIAVKASPTGYALLVWSQNFVDTTGKSYYGEHSLQYVQIFGGKNRCAVPIFDGQIHDIAWVASGDQFIVISGSQPSTATMFDKNCNPLFEFGKRYRNTIRICPFSNAVLIGGFGNLAGEVDFWDLHTQKELGKTKAYCTVSVEWAKDGKHVMCAVLHERVKVDNEIRIIRPNGQLVCTKSYKESELYDAQWQPYPPGAFKAPRLSDLGAKDENKEQAKPKKLYRPPGGGGAFSQLMKQEMSKTHETGPRRLNHGDYDEMWNEQEIKHAEASYAVEEPSSSSPVGAPWRKGQQQQQPQVQENFPTFSMEVKPSKHAKRRAKKKKLIVEEPQ